MADEIVRGIFQLGVDFKEVDAGLDKVLSKYTKVTDSADKQVDKIKELEKEEAKLLDKRSKTNNPTAIVQYNKALEGVRLQINQLQKDTDKLDKTQRQTAVDADKLGKSLQNAFRNTAVAGVNKQLVDAKKELREVEKQYNAVGNQRAFEKVEVKAKSLRLQLKELKAQLLETDDDVEFERLSVAAGKLQSKIDDATHAAKVFGTESPFEAVGTAIGGVGQKLLSLDFKGAADQSKILAKAASQITFKQSLQGVKDLGTTLFNIGKALLTNPIFLIGTAIALIIANFDKLKTSGGIVGTVFRTIGDIINGVKETFFALTDAIGLTTHALDEYNKRKIEGLSKQIDSDSRALDNFSKIVAASGKSTEEIEKRKNQLISENSKKQIDILRGIQKAKGILDEEEQKQLDEAILRREDAETQLRVIEQDSLKKRRDASKKYAEDINKLFDDLNKKLIDEQVKSTEFQIQNILNPGGQRQIQEVFNLRKRIEERQFKELEKNTLKEVKTKGDTEKAKLLLVKIRAQQEINFENDKNLAILNAARDFQQRELDLALETAQLELNAVDGTESEIAQQRLNIQQDYYNASIKLAEQDIEKRKQLGFNTVEQEKTLNQLRLKNLAETNQAEDNLNKLRTEEALKQINDIEKHEEAVLALRNKRQSTILKNDLKHEQDKLTVLQAGGEKYLAEAKEQQDKVNALAEEARKQEILEYVSYTETIINATLKATNENINSKIKEVDKQTSLQQKRVDEARSIADKGNAELLELEQKRLDDLNKKREAFVRTQQQLATIELIANTAITVSKAAAEGGAFAGVTIAAALIALAAGLISARQIASQAAFYEGGYTGDGNPRGESRAVGKKPYTYHNREFIFSHKHTDKYRDIFHDIHEGKIDLREMHRKSQLFEKMGRMQMQPYLIKNINNNDIRMDNVEKILSKINDSINSKDTVFSIDGFVAGTDRAKRRRTFIDRLAR